jgi:hypothetical protein
MTTKFPHLLTLILSSAPAEERKDRGWFLNARAYPPKTSRSQAECAKLGQHSPCGGVPALLSFDP